MPVLLNALDKIAPRVIFENVVNPHLHVKLLEAGYTEIDVQEFCSSFYKDFDAPPVEHADG